MGETNQRLDSSVATMDQLQHTEGDIQLQAGKLFVKILFQDQNIIDPHLISYITVSNYCYQSETGVF